MSSPRDYMKQERDFPDRDPDRPVSPPTGGVHIRPTSPHQIDIRAQFLADLRRLGGGNPHAPPGPEEGRVGGGHDSGSPPEGSLPPRKRKVSHEVGEDARDGREGAKIHLADHHKVGHGGGLNGHEQREEETARGSVVAT